MLWHCRLMPKCQWKRSIRVCTFSCTITSFINLVKRFWWLCWFWWHVLFYLRKSRYFFIGKYLTSLHLQLLQEKKAILFHSINKSHHPHRWSSLADRLSGKPFSTANQRICSSMSRDPIWDCQRISVNTCCVSLTSTENEIESGYQRQSFILGH